MFKVKGKRLYIHRDALDMDKLEYLATYIKKFKKVSVAGVGAGLMTIPVVLVSPDVLTATMASGFTFLGGWSAGEVSSLKRELALHLNKNGWEGILKPDAFKEFKKQGLDEKFPVGSLKTDFVGGHFFRDTHLKAKKTKKKV